MSSTARNRALACAFVHRPSPLGAFSFFTIVASDSDLLSSRAIGGRESVMVDPLAINPEPVGGSFKQLLPTLLFDVAMPIIGFYVLTSYGVPTLWALVAGGLFPASNNLRVWTKSRRLEPLGIIVMAFLAIGTAASLISGSVFFALIKESILTATFGFICLGSLLAERPLMFYINRQFIAGDDPALLEWWNGLWQYLTFRAAQRLVTAVWGITYLVEALLRVGLRWSSHRRKS